MGGERLGPAAGLVGERGDVGGGGGVRQGGDDARGGLVGGEGGGRFFGEGGRGGGEVDGAGGGEAGKEEGEEGRHLDGCGADGLLGVGRRSFGGLWPLGAADFAGVFFACLGWVMGKVEWKLRGGGS